uniref:Pyruvate carboxyltransferase domain-containing protein n=1 Tax=Aegilops tauschii subsp. strangulata TaxID=200361 RepID=A0A453JIV4_AEGTS
MESQASISPWVNSTLRASQQRQHARSSRRRSPSLLAVLLLLLRMPMPLFSSHLPCLLLPIMYCIQIKLTPLPKIQSEVSGLVVLFNLSLHDAYLISWLIVVSMSYIYRSDRVFLYHILGEVIKAGATSLSIPVGQHTPLHEFQELIADIKENTPGIENAIISTPCHDVLGLASANTLVGVFARAKQLEVTVTVSGERVGNSSMEEVVMEIKFSRELSGDLYTGVNTQGSTMKSKMMQEQSGLHAQLHNATLGAIAHEREINLECTEMLKFERTCEIASYVDIGLRRHVVRTKVVEHGYGITEKEFADLCKSSYKVVAEEQKPVAPLDSRMDITTLLYNTGQ